MAGSWVERLWQAQRNGWLTGEETWQILLDARDAPDPGQVVDTVLRGLAAAYRPPPPSPSEAEPVVIEDVEEALVEARVERR